MGDITWLCDAYLPFLFVRSESIGSESLPPAKPGDAHIIIVWKSPRSGTQQTTSRHGGGCNLSFADGHCEYWKFKDSRTVRLTNGEIGREVPCPDLEDASVDNPDLERMMKLLKGR